LEADVPPEYHRYLLVCLAVVAERCSVRDPRIPVPVRHRNWKQIHAEQRTAAVWHEFERAARNIAFKAAGLRTDIAASFVEGADASKADQVYANELKYVLSRPGLILTSPPYGAAQKYIRSTSIALGWTGLASSGELADLEQALIGREHIRKADITPPPDAELEAIPMEIRELHELDRLRGAIYTHYFREMDAAISAMANILKPGGSVVLVAGSNEVSGRRIATHRYLRDSAVRHGLVPLLELRDTIRGRVLLTKRASRSAPLRYETIHVLRKPTA
jgi:hypothetical protein